MAFSGLKDFTGPLRASDMGHLESSFSAQAYAISLDKEKAPEERNHPGAVHTKRASGEEVKSCHDQYRCCIQLCQGSVDMKHIGSFHFFNTFNLNA